MNEEGENRGSLARRTRWAGALGHCRDLLARRWWVPCSVALAAVVTFALLSRFQAPAYLSVGRMIVNVKLSIPQGSMFTEELSNFLGTQAALMQSDVVLNRASAAAAATSSSLLSERPVLKVSVTPRTTIFNLQCRGAQPLFTQAFLQSAMEEYIRLKREMRKQASDSTVAGLTEELLNLERDLRTAEDQIAEFHGTNSMLWLEEQGNSLGNYLAGLNQKLEAMKSEHDLLQTLTLDQNVQRQEPDAAAVSGGPTAGNTASTNALVNNNSLAADYLKARQQLLLMKAEQQDMSQYLRPRHPKMVAMAEEISRRERLLEIFRQQNVEQLEARKASLALQIQNLERDVAEWNARIVDLSRRAAQYQRLKSNAQRLHTLYQQLVGTVQTLDANKEVGAESVAIMEAASPALLDTRRSRNNLAFVILGGLFCSGALLLCLNRLDDRVNSFSDLQELFEEPVLAQIPRERLHKNRLQLLHAADDRLAFVEAYRNLRSSLFYLTDTGRRPKTLLLTSTIPHEGKSVTAANLAVTLAAGGSRVLLVDADLRKGVLHTRFNLPETCGLSEVLSGDRPWQPFVKATVTPNLSLLPRGRPTTSSGDLYLRSATAQFLSQASALYDFVVLDTPPVMATDDATTLAPHADAVLFVLRAEHTSARVAHAALALLYQRNARVMGIVFNAVCRKNSEYYCYRYKDYYENYPPVSRKGDLAQNSP